MRLAALFSGGKDSALAAHLAARSGHDIACLVSVTPSSPESMLYHHPNTALVALQAEAMRTPHVAAEQRAGASDEEALLGALRRAAAEHGIDGVVHGGIRSAYQMRRISGACGALGLRTVSPVWGADDAAHMRMLLDEGFCAIITSVSAGGLDAAWLGRELDAAAIAELARLSEKHGFNLCFEGGEAETFVVDSPAFAARIEITESAASWDGCRGILEIKAARLSARV